MFTVIFNILDKKIQGMEHFQKMGMDQCTMSKLVQRMSRQNKMTLKAGKCFLILESKRSKDDSFSYEVNVSYGHLGRKKKKPSAAL